MNDFELTRMADALLRTLPRDPEAPHYTEDSFRCKLAAAHRRNRGLRRAARHEGHSYLVQEEWRVVLQKAMLTERQKQVVAMRMLGKTFEEIGSMSGCSKQAVLNVLHQANRKIRRIQSEYPYEGLAEIYKSEISRGVRTGGKGKLVR